MRFYAIVGYRTILKQSATGGNSDRTQAVLYGTCKAPAPHDYPVTPVIAGLTHRRAGDASYRVQSSVSAQMWTGEDDGYSET